jgi:RHS repeat-associated protein
MGAAALKAGHSNTIFSVRDIVGYNSTTSEWEVVQSYEFDPHGVPLPGSGAGSVTSAKTYHGGLSVNDDLADTGLYLMGHRFWAPELGRFLSRDPIGFLGGLNLFGTGFGNNPMTFVDPSGLRDFTVGGVTYSVMLNDADPLPSNPHAHIESGRYAGHKIDLSTGEIKSTSKGHAGEVMGTLSKKELGEFQDQIFKAYGKGVMIKVPGEKGCYDYITPFTKGGKKVFSVLLFPLKILDVVGTAQEVKGFVETVREGTGGPLKIPTIYVEPGPNPEDRLPRMYMIGPSIFQVVPILPGMES